MKKMIIFLSLLVISFAQINYKSYAQTTFPNPSGHPADPAPTDPDPYPNPTSHPDTGPIEAGSCGTGCNLGAKCGGAGSGKRCNSKCECTANF